MNTEILIFSLATLSNKLLKQKTTKMLNARKGNNNKKLQKLTNMNLSLRKDVLVIMRIYLLAN